MVQAEISGLLRARLVHKIVALLQVRTRDVEREQEKRQRKHAKNLGNF